MTPSFLNQNFDQSELISAMAYRAKVKKSLSYYIYCKLFHS